MASHPSEDAVSEPWLWSTNGLPPKGDKSSILHLLEPPFGDPIPLPVSDKLVVGRDPKCQVRISSPSVSRRHAEIRFRGSPPRAYLLDLGTKNGTRLSGAPVRGERTLDSGDVIRFGDVTAIYRIVRPGDKRTAPAPKVPETFDTTTDLGSDMAVAGAFNGDARLVPIDGLLGRLTIVRASGRLEVRVDGTVGHLTLKDGSITKASFGGRDGNVAIRAIAALRRGHFQFNEDSEDGRDPQSLTPAHPIAAVAGERLATFSREGATWLVGLPGGTPVRVAHVRGLAMLERLLARPMVEVEAFELARIEGTKSGTGKSSGVESDSGTSVRRKANGAVGAATDGRARQQYEARARELEDLVVSGAAGPGVVDELAALEQQLRSSGGGPSDAERARSSVTHAVKRALAAIRQAELGARVHGAPIARHFEDSVTTGARLAYRPAKGAPGAWRLTGGIVVAVA